MNLIVRVAISLGAVALLGLGPAVLGACGSDDDGGQASNADNPPAANARGAGRDVPPGYRAISDRDQIRGVYSMFLEGVEDSEPRSACVTISRSAKQRFASSGTTCRQQFVAATASGAYDDLEWPIATIDVSKVAGDAARGTIERPNGDRLPIRFVKEGEEWRVDAALGIGE